MKKLALVLLCLGCGATTPQEHSQMAKDAVDVAYTECQAYYREPAAKHSKLWDDICYGVMIAKEAE